MEAYTEDRRRHPRSTALIDVFVTNEFGEAVAAKITDINGYGARLKLETEIAARSFFILDVQANVAHRATVAWRQHPLIGTRFVESWLLGSDASPDWLKRLRRKLLLEQAEERGIRLVWSAPDSEGPRTELANGGL